MNQPKIGIIMGSKSDWPLVESALKKYKNLDLPCTVMIASAHRTPKLVEEWIRKVEKAGVEVIIAVAGMSAALPGVIASHTLLPVIGVPVESGSLRGHDALYSIVQMPPGIPVASVGINNVKNALLMAMNILGIKYPEFRKRLETFRSSQKAMVISSQEELIEKFPEYDIFVTGDNRDAPVKKKT
jgi:5-(carboxyamino)imidazole ribonucleotide mutase